ncbi:MAG: triose-phosphate isomerase [Candidatus Paceibacterota bacterium]|jgi:triosephosphate isomerase
MDKILVANWKMNPVKEGEVIKLAKASDQKNVVICPPFIYLKSISKLLRKAKLGAQDAGWSESGPFTGGVSAPMLKNFKVEYVILGHSERRLKFNETDEMIAEKVKSALTAGLKVILCVGEPAAIRKQGTAAAKKYIAAQLKKDLSKIGNLKLGIGNLLIAYEPIWAISTSRDQSLKETPEIILEMINFIKNNLKSLFINHKSSVLYGGSVTSKNIKRIINHEEISGALVGGASLNSKEFSKIIKLTYARK